jgi:hypothetical protein
MKLRKVRAQSACEPQNREDEAQSRHPIRATR